jgi:formate-dependent nitrite reductase membrane component NrfD
MESGRKLETLVFLGKMMQTTVMEIFKDNNEWNEKSVVGFIAFAIMCVIMIVDLITGWLGRDLMINEFVYDSFVLVVLGCFGISGLEKFAKK